MYIAYISKTTNNENTGCESVSIKKIDTAVCYVSYALQMRDIRHFPQRTSN